MPNRDVISTCVLVPLALAFCAITDAHAQSVLNLGYAKTGRPPAKVSGNRVAFAVDEAKQGADLDGDGAANDLVLFVRDETTGTTTNTGISALDPQSISLLKYEIGTRLCLGVVHEAAVGPLGTDRNGDGDVLDDVLAAYDLATGTTTNLGLAIWTTPALDWVAMRETRVLFPVPESAQGNADLNGDGDTSDLVLFSWIAGGGPAVSLGLAVAGGSMAIGYRHAMTLASETSSGVDFNGDADTNDSVVHVYDFVTGSWTNVGYAASEVRCDGELFAFTAIESSQGTDLDGDGDVSDFVLYGYVGPTGALTFLGPVYNTGHPAFAVRGYVVAWASKEDALGAGVDANADGDVADTTLFAWHARTGVVHSTGLAVWALGSSEMVGFAIADDWIGCYVSESAQGGQDLNADGDAFDRIVHTYNVRTSVASNLGISASPIPALIQATSSTLAFTYDEFAQGLADQNGDGTLSGLLAVHSFVFGTTTVVPQAMANNSDFTLAGNRVLFLAAERPGFPPGQPPGTDWNGDGDVLDSVLFVYEPAFGSTNLGLASLPTQGPPTIVASSRVAALAVNESAQSGTSLNGDADTTDDVIHVIRWP